MSEIHVWIWLSSAEGLLYCVEGGAIGELWR